MKILIVEDEPLAAEQIIDYLHDIDGSFEILDTIDSVRSGVDWFKSHKTPDCIISDIRLLDGLSFDIYSQVNIDCPIIFTTAYDEFAIKAFELNSVGYLLKPIRKEKLKECIQKIKPADTAKIDLDKIAQLLKQSSQVYKSRFLVKIGQKIKAISVDKIAYFKSFDKLTYIVVRSGEKYPIDQSLEEVDAILNPNDFFRINRKYITHIEGIKEVHPYFKGRLKIELVPDSGEDITVSSEKTPMFKSWLDK